MRQHMIRRVMAGRRGFTLIELLIALVIVSLIGGAAGTVVVQMLQVNAVSTHRIMAIRQVQNAGFWFSQDAQTAQEVTVGGGATGFPVVMTWHDWDTAEAYRVEYDVNAASELTRHYTVTVGGVVTEDRTVLISQYLDLGGTPPATVFRQVTLPGGQATERYSLTVTATIAGYPETVSETRTYEVLPRPRA